MTIKELRNFLIKKTEMDGYILVNIKIDGCFMIVEALEKKQDDKVYEDDTKVLIGKLKEDPTRLFAPRGGKVNMCDYIEHYKKNKNLRNRRHHQKYGERLYEPSSFFMQLNIDQEEKENLDYVMQNLI